MMFNQYLRILFLILFSGIPYFNCSAAEKPNVLFIAIDDLNNWIGRLQGHPQAKTPNIDRLTEMGVLFSNCHCAAPACNPSRVACMTGRRPSSSGIYFNGTPWKPALESMTTLPQYFQQHGYYALGSGKIYHSGHPASWNEYAPSKSRHTFPKEFKFPRNVSGLNRAHFDWSPLPQSAAEMPDYKTIDFVTKQLQKEWEQPFFLACGIFRPHLPWYVPQEYFDQFPIDDIRLPEVLADDLNDIPAAGIKMAKPTGDHAAVIANHQWKHAVQGYLASIAFADDMIGRLLSAYEQSPYKEQTIIVFWTDHGWNLGEKQHWRKFALWYDTTNVPLAIVVPGMEHAGSICQAPVNLIDLYPTLIDLCGLETKADLEGTSLVDFLNDPSGETDHISITTHGPNNHAVQSEHWRYIRYANGEEELYDHRNDPREWKNLADDPKSQTILSRMKAHLPKVNVAERNLNE